MESWNIQQTWFQTVAQTAKLLTRDSNFLMYFLSPHTKPFCPGSLYKVNIGSRHLSLYPLVIGCLGLLNIILLYAAFAIGIYCEYLKHICSGWLKATNVIKENTCIYLLRLSKKYDLVNVRKKTLLVNVIIILKLA